MKVVKQITFEAKNDAEALRLAGERLGKDAVILSTRNVRVGGVLGFFQHHILMVTAGVLQDEAAEGRARSKENERDDATAKERLVAFQKLLEFKQATETRATDAEPAGGGYLPAASDGPAKVIYSPADVVGNKSPQASDSVYLSSAGLSSANAETVSRRTGASRSLDGLDTAKLREDVVSLSERLDKVLQHFDNFSPLPSGGASQAKTFEEGFPLGPSSAPDRRIGNSEPYRKLLSAEVDPVHAQKLVEDYGKSGEDETFVKWLETTIRCAADTSTRALGGRKVMLLGPTGVGKTTTIAKLAAIQALWEHKNVLLLTSDTYRIAAVDQLRTYAKILGVPIEVVYEVENLAGILEKHADADLILLDTAGRAQKDRKNLGTSELLHRIFKPDAVHLVLAANMKYRDMRDVVKRMSTVPISHVIFTKLDETVSYGALFNVLKFLDRPVSFLTTGQNVPNDIEVASAARFVEFLTKAEVEESAR